MKPKILPANVSPSQNPQLRIKLRISFDADDVPSNLPRQLSMTEWLRYHHVHGEVSHLSLRTGTNTGINSMPTPSTVKEGGDTDPHIPRRQRRSHALIFYRTGLCCITTLPYHRSAAHRSYSSYLLVPSPSLSLLHFVLQHKLSASSPMPLSSPVFLAAPDFHSYKR